MRKIRLPCVCALAVAAALSVACSDGSLQSLTAPSPLGAASDATAAVPTVDRSSGTVVDGNAATEWAVNTGWMTADGLMVEGSDVITAVAGSCPDHVITVRGVPVSVNSGTAFGGGITCGTLATGLTVHISGLLTVNNGAYAVIATAISVDERTVEGGGTGRGRSHVGGEGTVASLTGSCPALSMVVRGTRVHTSTSTVFENGACGNLRNGTKVEVEGDTSADGSLDATRVRLIDQPGGGGQGRTSGEGTVAAVRGTCPALTMVVRGYSVMTSASTTYAGGRCENLRPGVKVLITGVNQGNSLMAETIEIKE